MISVLRMLILAALLASSAAASDEYLRIIPEAPDSDDTIVAEMGGVWNNSCVPRDPSVTRVGNTIKVQLDRTMGFCFQVFTSWSETVNLGKLDPGLYRLEVTIAGDSTSRPEFTLMFSVTDATPPPPCAQPAIMTEPLDVSSAGGVVTLTVAASGTAPLQYQWYRGSRGDTANPIGGAVSASVITPPFASGQTTARYWVRVINACGQADSRTAVVSLTDPCASVPLEAVAFEYRGAISGCAPGAVSCLPGELIRFTPELFVNGSLSCLDRIVESSTFDWNFGDGRISSERSPSHAFSGNGPYTVTLTVTHASGQRQATQRFEFAPQVVITGFPAAIVGSTGGGDTTSYTLRNVGGTSTTVNLSRQGTFFSQSPESFTLAPGSSRQITITSLPVPEGRSEGRSIVSGQGVPAGTFAPIIIFAVAPPIGNVVGVTITTRVDVSSPVGAPIVTGTASFTNSGTATLTGVLAADVPWLIPSPDIVSIAPGQVREVSFTIDPGLRPDGGGIGTYVAELSLVYRLGTGQISKQSDADSSTRPTAGTGSASTSATVSHTASAAAPAGVAPPLREGEVAIFLPGIAHVPGSVGVFKSDLTLTNLTSRLLSRLQMYFKPAGTSSPRGTAPFDIRSGDQISFADIAQSSFQNTSEVGSLQVRGATVGSISASATVFNSSNPAGSYGTTIPAFRSDRSAGPGERIYLAGITSSADTHTNVYLQEASGLPATATVEFFSAQGVSLGSRTEGVEAFGLRQLNSSAPVGAVSAVVTTTPESVGRLLAYATPVDRASGDTWAVADWSKHYGYDPAGPVLIPVAAAQEGANDTYFRTDVAIMNRGTAVGSGTMRFQSRGGSTTDRTIALPSGQSMIIADVLVNLFGIAGADGGYIVFTPDTGAFAITSRTYATVAGRPGTFGTGVPTLALSSGISGDRRIRFGGLSDASGDSVQDRRPHTFRTNAILVETAGQPVTVTATLRYTAGGVNTTAQPVKSVDYTLGPRQYIQINQISHTLLGAETRSALGDLSNMQLEFTVKAGNGAVVALTSSVDNGTGDSSLRVD